VLEHTLADGDSQQSALVEDIVSALQHPYGRKSLIISYSLDETRMSAALSAACAAWPAGNVDAVEGVLRVYPTVRKAVVPPHRIPPTLYNEFTLDGRIPVGSWYWNQAVDAQASPIVVTWSAEKLAGLAELAAQRKQNYYGSLDTMLYTALDRNPIRGKAVVIMGSLEPWYEVRIASRWQNRHMYQLYNALLYVSAHAGCRA